MEKAKKQLPKWVLKYKKKGIEIRSIKNSYYAYKMESRWNPKKKRAKKITGEYLGSIKEEGLIPPKHKRVLDEIKYVTLKEYGASRLITHLSTDIKQELQKIYSEDWQTIFCMSVIRFFKNAPIKNMKTHFIYSHLSDLFSQANMSSKHLSELLQKIGSQREKMVEFMNHLISGSEQLLVDLTHIFSSSENITWLSLGHNSKEEYHPQINMLLIFSKDKNKPVFFRLLDGAIKDVSSIKATIKESGIKNVVFIGDKGFYSKGNVNSFETEHMDYILPLKRNSTLINYKVMKQGDKKAFDGYFFFENRHIWYKEEKKNKRRVILFFDERLKTEEEKCFLARVDKDQETINTFYQNQYKLGTITILTKAKHSCKNVYHYLKSRSKIEVVFDVFKNILEADKTYMRTNEHFYGWMFINFISLLFYYSIYGILISNNLINNYSPKDVILYFSKVYKVRVSEREVISEMPKKTRLLVEKMKLDPNILRNL